MWVEPLVAGTADAGSHTVAVTVTAGDGAVAARALCAYSRAAGCGFFGEMVIVDAAGAPRQRARALVLLVREALRYADTLGITHVETEAPVRLRAFAARMSGLAHADGVFSGELSAVRSHNLLVTQADGSELESA
jgi:G3E family GTPase